MATNYAVAHVKRTINISIGLVIQIAILLFVAGVVLWTVLFTGLPATHNFFHELRHALFLIPCH